MWTNFLVVLISVILVRGMVDLFQHKVSAFRNGVTEEIGCESLILENFKKRNGTGVNVSIQVKKSKTCVWLFVHSNVK